MENEFVAGTLDEAVEKLAAMATRARAGWPEKSAAGDFLSGLGAAVQANPTLSHALLGGGAGALVGGAGAAAANAGKDPARRRSVMRTALTGGLAGLGLGAGLGLARTAGGNLSAGGGADAPRAGEFVDATTGQRMAVDPKALRDHPDLAKRIKALTTPTFQTAVAGGVGSAVDKIREQIPTTAALFPWVAGADALAHAPGIGLSRVAPGQVGGHYGQLNFDRGLQGHDMGGREKLKDVIRRNLAPGTRPEGELAVAGGSPASGSGWRGVLHRLRNGAAPGGGALGLGRQTFSPTDTTEVASLTYPKTETVKVRESAKTTGPGGPNFDSKHLTERPVTRPVLDADNRPVMSREAMNAGEVASIKARGAELEGRQAYRVPGTNRYYRGMTSVPRALGLRAGLYGVPMAGEYLARGLADDAKSRQTLRELMQQYAKPVPEGK